MPETQKVRAETCDPPTKTRLAHLMLARALRERVVVRYVVGFVFTFGLVAFPPSVGAQVASETSSAEPVEVAFIPEHLQHRVPGQRSKKTGSEPAPKEPALQLELDDAGVEVAPSPPRTPDGYTLEEMELRVKQAKIGLGASAGIWAFGFALVAAGLTGDCNTLDATPDRCDPLYFTGSFFTTGGLIGMITSGVLLSKRKRDRRWLRETHYGAPRRVQWDLARSRLVF
jgi:hypothetical protein